MTIQNQVFRRLSAGPILILLVLAATRSGLAQSNEGVPNPIRLGSPHGVRTYVPGRWATMALEVSNDSDQDQTVRAITYVDQQWQYGRDLWVPANAVRRSWYPLYVHSAPDGGQPFFALSSQFLLLKDGRKSLIEGNASLPIHPTRVPFYKGRNQQQEVVTSMIVDQPDQMAERLLYASQEGADDPDPAYTALQEIRARQGQSPKVIDFVSDTLPTTALAFDAMDQILVASDRVADDPASVEALQQWVHNGGHLWLMLDRVSETTARLLLADFVDYEVFDKVTKTRVVIRPPTGAGADTSAYVARDYANPVTMLRLLVDDVEVTHVDEADWPVCFIKKVGRGHFVVSTMEVRGLLWQGAKPVGGGPVASGPPSPINRRAPTGPAAGNASATLSDLGQTFLGRRDDQRFTVEQLKPYLSGQIGYRIVSRGWIILILGLLCLFLLGAAVVLISQGKQDRLLWIAPALVVISSGVLYAVGVISKRSVEPTLAMTQWIEVTPASNSLHIEGAMAVYNSSPSREKVGGNGGGRFVPLLDASGPDRLLLYSDDHEFQWERIVLAPGVQMVPFVKDQPVASPPQATARFTAEGIAGTIRGPFERLEHPLVVTGQGRMALTLDGKEFTAGLDDVLGAGRFTKNTLVEDRERRRAGVLDSMLTRSTQFPERPSVLVWAKPIDTGFRFPAQSNVVGDALVSIPISFQRVPPKTKVRIPSPFVAYRTASGPDKKPPSSTYNAKTRKWIGPFESGNLTWLRFQVPASALPLNLEQVRLSMDIEASGYELTVLGSTRQGTESLELDRRTSPIGVYELTVDDPAVLTLDANGGLMLGIDVKSTGPKNAWRLSNLRLEVHGATQ